MVVVVQGDLKKYLRACRPTKPEPLEHLSAADLNAMVGQVAAAMQYLESKHVIHRDLAARLALLKPVLLVLYLCPCFLCLSKALPSACVRAHSRWLPFLAASETSLSRKTTLSKSPTLAWSASLPRPRCAFVQPGFCKTSPVPAACVVVCCVCLCPFSRGIQRSGTTTRSAQMIVCPSNGW